MNLPGFTTHHHFATTLAKGLHRPCWGRVPGRLIRPLLGEFASALLDDQRVVPGKAMTAGFTFAHPSWDDLLHDVFASETAPATCQPATAR